MQAEQDGQSGFSLTELMVAMVVTLLVSGAIFGLLASGQSAFRREPELTDRQQNIRAASAMIQTDLQVAGMEMPPFIQAFTNGLNSVDNTIRSGSGRPNNAPSVINNNEMADELEVWGNDGLCPTLSACGNWQGASGNTQEALPTCYRFPTLVLLSDGVRQEVRWGCKPGQGANQSCAGNNPNGHVVFPPGQSVLNPPGGGDLYPTTVSVVQRVRYEIRMDAQGVPNLWRSPTGGLAPPDQGQCNSDGGVGGNGMQLVARGIEDMQVWYQNGDDVAADTWRTTPGVVTCATCGDDPPVLSGSAADWNTIIRRVRVILSARTTLPGAPLQGETVPDQGTAPNAVRGRLTIEVTPRAALFHLSQSSPAPPLPMWR